MEEIASLNIYVQQKVYTSMDFAMNFYEFI